MNALRGAACIGAALLLSTSLCGESAATDLWQSYGDVPPPVAPFVTTSLPTRRVVVPIVFPVIDRVVKPNGRIVPNRSVLCHTGSYNRSRGDHRHTGVDIVAPRMTPVVAPFDGRIGFKVQSFWIYGDNGYRCLGTHLNDDTPGTRDNSAKPDFMFAPGLRMGMRVRAGQLIGYVGDSGKATGPHLHFELHGPDGVFNPTPSLHTAQHLPAPRAAFPEREARPAPGESRLIGYARGFDSQRGVLTLQVAARQDSRGRTWAAVRPTRTYVFLRANVIEEAGGPEALSVLDPARPVSLYVVPGPAHGGLPSRGRATRAAPPYAVRATLHDPPTESH